MTDLGTWRGYRRVRMERHETGTYPVLECSCVECGARFERRYRALYQSLKLGLRLLCPACVSPLLQKAAGPDEPLKSARIRSGVTVRSIASRVGISETHVRSYERRPFGVAEVHRAKLDQIYGGFS